MSSMPRSIMAERRKGGVCLYLGKKRKELNLKGGKKGGAPAFLLLKREQKESFLYLLNGGGKNGEGRKK